MGKHKKGKKVSNGGSSSGIGSSSILKSSSSSGGSSSSGSSKEAAANSKLLMDFDPIMDHLLLTQSAKYKVSSITALREGCEAYSSGYINKASDLFRSAIDYDPRNEDAYLGLGTALFMLQRYHEAREVLEKAQKCNIRCAGISYVLGMSYLELFDLKNAILCFTDAKARNPEHIKAYYGLGRALFKAEQYNDSIIPLTIALVNMPGMAADIHYMLGVALITLKKSQDVILHFHEVLRSDRTHADCCYYGLGIALEQLGNSEKAIACYKEAIRINPNYVEAHSSLGLILAQSDKPEELEEAKSHFTKLLEIGLNHADVHNYNLGTTLHKLGRQEAAVVYYKEAIRINPKYAKAYYSWGVALEDLGNLEEARKCYEKAIKFDPNYVLAHCNLGVILYKSRLNNEAIRCFEEAIRLDPNCADAHYNRGVIFENSKELEEAKGSYEEAIKINPNYANAYCTLGCVLYKLGLIEEAIKHFVKAIRLDPKCAEARSNLETVLLAEKCLLACEKTKTTELVSIISASDFNITSSSSSTISLLTQTPSAMFGLRPEVSSNSGGNSSSTRPKSPSVSQ